MIKISKNQELRRRLIATDDCHRLIATDEYHRLIANKSSTDGFLQLDFHWTRNLKTETGTRYQHPEQGVLIKNISTTWNTRQVKMREYLVGLNCYAL